jgi:signal transduction histidine kinase
MSLDALYRIADLVAHTREPEEMYGPAVDAMIAATGSDRAALLLFDGAGVMRFKASRFLSEGYRKAVEGHSPWTADSKDPAPILVADVAAEASLGPLRNTILAEGIRSLGFIPMGRPGRLLGKFMVYYNEPHEFSETELQVAAMVCHYVAFGLDRAKDEADIQDLLDRERVARHQAEALNRAKDDFLAVLSHELRNPLGAIINAVSVLDRASRREPFATKAQDVIRRQTAHLARLLDDLLDAAKIGRGHLELRLEVTDLRSPAAAAVEKLSYQFAEKHQALQVSVPDHAVSVEGDPNRLQQVIANLLDNASKYTPEAGSIWLRLDVEANHAVIRVRDNGPGIPVSQHRFIFDPFTQGGAPRTPGAGLGIGLGLVKRIVELHTGTVDVQSGNAGTEFTVRLPLTVETPPTAPDLASVTVRRQRVVLIEDNDDGREALVTALGLLGHEIQAARTGQAGIELVLRGQPRHVLVDIGLPDIDGYEVARRLRFRLGNRVTLVALTGFGQQTDRQRSAEAGFDAHLVKPVDPAELLRLLAGLT